MDREVLIQKLMAITKNSYEELNKLSNEDLFSYYQDLEDDGIICDYSD